MVKLINYIIKADKARLGASLQVVPLTDHLGCKLVLTGLNCIYNYEKIFWTGNFEGYKKFCLKYFSLNRSYRKYNKPQVIPVLDNEKKISQTSCKICNKAKFLVKIRSKYWRFPRCIGLNRLHRAENVKLCQKLYRTILGKYRYTSPELVVQSAVLTARHTAEFRSCNPVRVTNGENNKEHCHNLWQL